MNYLEIDGDRKIMENETLPRKEIHIVALIRVTNFTTSCTSICCDFYQLTKIQFKAFDAD